MTKKHPGIPHRQQMPETTDSVYSFVQSLKRDFLQSDIDIKFNLTIDQILPNFPSFLAIFGISDAIILPFEIILAKLQTFYGIE
jgi:hypothetical protein